MNRYLPLIVFVVVLAIGLGMTVVVHNAEETAIRTRFEVVADDAVDRVHERVNQHVVFLLAAHSFFEVNDGAVGPAAFSKFVESFDLEQRFPGIQGIGFARLMPTGDEAKAAAELRRNYGILREVWPETDQGERTPIVLLEPDDERNRTALGYDMYSEPVRRQAMLSAIGAGDVRASAPVELVQEITDDKQQGFLVYVPLRERLSTGEDGPVVGFVYAPFRAGDLHTMALERLSYFPAAVETRDTTDESGGLLYRSQNFGDVLRSDTIAVERTLQVAGRTWTMSIRSTPEFRSSFNDLGTFTLATISLLLAVALAASTRSQMKAVAAARELNAVSEKTIADKDLMLQEMKHRIKNSIARVLAIARNTAAHSDSLDDFETSFSARLQAMANAQDMLTRSHWQRADLAELLSTELEQVFGANSDATEVSGPPVDLSERATQALGLVFHELATNALKYGGMSGDDVGLVVRWEIVNPGASAMVELDWIEPSAKADGEPERKGFGTRLIDANIKGELGGTIERKFGAEGTRIHLSFPLARCR